MKSGALERVRATAGECPDFTAVFDGLPSRIAVVGSDGRIVAVNAAWHSSASAGGVEREWIGEDYLALCRSEGADLVCGGTAVASALDSVLRGRADEVKVEYGCDQNGRTAYAARVTPLRAGGGSQAVVTHDPVHRPLDMEQAARASEARFRSLIENASDVITILDEDGTIEYESPSAVRMLGFRHSERVGNSFFDFVHAEDLPALMKDFASSLERPDHKFLLEFRTRHRDGRWRIIEGTAKNLLGEPSVVGVVVNFREITERKRAEEAQARLTAVMDWTPNFICIADPHGRLNWTNKAMQKLLQQGPGSNVGSLNLTDLFPQWSSDLLLHEAMPAAVANGVWSGEMALLNKDGIEIPVLQVVLAHRSPSGGVEYFSTIAHDITERKQTEAALRESDEVFRQIAENINEMLWIFDLEVGEPIYVSPGYERIWGRPVETAYEDPAGFLSSVAPAGRQRIGHLETGGETRGRDEEFRITHRDGSQRWLRGRSFPIRDARGSVSRIVGLTEDISDRKRMETDLRQAQRLEAIGSLAAGVAHEINTPIQYVGDNVRFLQEAFTDLSRVLEQQAGAVEAIREGREAGQLSAAAQGTADEVDLEYLIEEIPRATEQSLEGVERVAEIVRAMKEFSHPGSAEKKPVDLNHAIQSTLTVARNEWRYLAELVTEFDAALPLVPCYPSELNQAILNVIVNAAHAIESVISEDGSELGTLTISTGVVGGAAEVRIRDSGCGIPEDVRPRVFDPFFTTKEVGRGTGQGLTLVHSVIVDRHGGSVHFDTELGQGTTFVLRLPLGGESNPEPGEDS